MTFQELKWFLKGARDKEESDLRNTRLLMWAVFNADPYRKKKIKLTDLFSLPSDSAHKVKRSGISEKRHRELIAIYQRIKAKNGN